MKLKWILLTFLLSLAFWAVVLHVVNVRNSKEATAKMQASQAETFRPYVPTEVVLTQAPEATLQSTPSPAPKPTPRPARTPRATPDPAITPSPTPKAMSFIGEGEEYAGIDGRFYTVQQAAEPMELTVSRGGEFDFVGSYEAVKGQQTEFSIIEEWEWVDSEGKTHFGTLLTVDGETLRFYSRHFRSVYCVDVNRADQYKELFIFTGSDHSDSYLVIVRYDGKKLWQMCEGIFANRFTYCNPETLEPETCVTLNGEGIITVPSDRFDLVKPVIVSSMWKETDGMLVQTPGTEIVEGKRYTLKKGELFFIKDAYENVPNFDDLPWYGKPGDGIIRTKKGDYITFIEQREIMRSKKDKEENMPFGMVYCVNVNGQHGYLYDYFMWCTDVY